jgi:hypothetical protein
MEIGNRTEATMQATLTIRTAIGRRRPPGDGSLISVCRMLTRLQATVVSGSDHPCWQRIDAAASVALQPAREQDRLLNAGLIPRHR